MLPGHISSFHVGILHGHSGTFFFFFFLLCTDVVMRLNVILVLLIGSAWLAQIDFLLDNLNVLHWAVVLLSINFTDKRCSFCVPVFPL